MKVNQRKATVNTLLAVLEERGVDYATVSDEHPIADILSPEDKAKTREILFTMFRTGKIEYKETFQPKVDDDAKLKSYISGLVNNWIRKAKELNLGQAYVPKNKGSRAGQSDPEVKEMRKLLSVTSDADAKATIQATIDAKVAEIKAAKTQVTVDYDQLPAELREKLGL